MKEPNNKTVKITLRIFFVLVRLGCEFGFPIVLFLVAPLNIALAFLIVFILWQLYSYFILAPAMREYTRELDETKEHIHSVVRRYKDVTDANFLFSFIRNFDLHLNPQYYTEERRKLRI